MNKSDQNILMQLNLQTKKHALAYEFELVKWQMLCHSERLGLKWYRFDPRPADKNINYFVSDLAASNGA